MDTTTQVAQWIREAAQRMDAEVFAPDQWAGDHDGAWALVRRSDRRTVISVHGDELAHSANYGTMWNDVVVAYAYATEHDVMAAEDIVRAVRTDDGASADPVGYGEGALDFLAGTIAASIVDAATQAADNASAAGKLRADVAAELPASMRATVIPQLGESHVAVLIWETSDVATVVMTDDGRISVEGAGNSNDNVEFDDVASAVRYVISERGSMDNQTAATALGMIGVGALIVWLATGWIPVFLGY